MKFLFLLFLFAFVLSKFTMTGTASTGIAYTDETAWSDLNYSLSGTISLSKGTFINLVLESEIGGTWNNPSIAEPTEIIRLVGFGNNYNADGKTYQTTFSFEVLESGTTTMTFTESSINDPAFTKTYIVTVDVLS